MELRPYQADARDRTLAALSRGELPAVVAQCGAGKTVIGAAVASSYRRPLWVTHTHDLVSQAERRVGCAVRSVQGLLASGDSPDCDLVVLDEMHHFVSPEWGTVARRLSTVPTFGLTATPERGDGVALGSLATTLVVAAQIPDLIRDGWLVPADVWAPGRKLQGIVDPVEAWLERASGMRTVVYARDVETSRRMAASWPVPAVAVDSKMPTAERDEAIARFAAGDVQVIVNAHILAEGWDVPGIECVVLARGCSSTGSYLQATGRALRPAPGKTRALVLDCGGSVWSYGLPDDAREYSLTGKAISGSGSDGERLEPIRQCRRCGAVFAAPGLECPRCGARVARPLTRAQRIERRERLQQVSSAHTDDRRGQVWRELQDEARRRGFKPGWAFVQFKIRYGGPPPRTVRAA